jgi:magnesium chelatase family protein
MATKSYTISEGHESGVTIEIECHTSNGLPGITIVGLASKPVDEAKERLRSAFTSSGITFPKKKLVLNLAPADLPKESAGMDVAIAVSILLDNASGVFEKDLSKTVFFGELALNGTIRPVRGLIGKLSRAIHNGFSSAVIPATQAKQASLIDGIDIYACNTLNDVVTWMGEINSVGIAQNDTYFEEGVEESYGDSPVLLEDVAGHEMAKRALLVGVAGGHNIIMNGPPGTGKTMLAKAAPSIMPRLTKAQILELSDLYSLVGSQQDALILAAPFRSPHHSSSSVSIIGGGQRALPGEISLASHGVLLMDELPEFHRDCLEALRQPLEDGIVHISRAKQRVTYPASFMLIATKNPCPCGNYGTTRICNCSGFEIQRYNKKLSGPILDRIDIYTEVEEIPYDQLGKQSNGSVKSNELRKLVEKAREVQEKRNPKSKLNSKLSLKELLNLKMSSPESLKMLELASEKLSLSARGYVRTLRLAHSIADLDSSPIVFERHIAEALQMRPKSV